MSKSLLCTSFISEAHPESINFPARARPSNPQPFLLPKACRIYPKTIKCWGFAPKPDEDRAEAFTCSVPRIEGEDRHMLNMAGVANSTE